MTPAAPQAGTAPRAPFTVFLDRDGVLNELHYPGIRSVAGFHWLPGAREAVARLNRPEVQVILVTNQPMRGLGPFLLSRRRLDAIHAHMLEGLRAAGGRIDRIEVATALPFVPSRRRKPRPGMLEDAARALPVDKARAVMVGDTHRDEGAARAFGIPFLMVGRDVPDLATAVVRIAAMLAPQSEPSSRRRG